MRVSGLNPVKHASHHDSFLFPRRERFLMSPAFALMRHPFVSSQLHSHIPESRLLDTVFRAAQNTSLWLQVALLSSALFCSSLLDSARFCFTPLYSALLYSALLCCIVLCATIIVLYSTLLCFTLLCFSPSPGSQLYSSSIFDTVPEF